MWMNRDSDSHYPDDVPMYVHRFIDAQLISCIPLYGSAGERLLERWRSYHFSLPAFRRWKCRSFYESITPPSSDMIQMELF